MLGKPPGAEKHKIYTINIPKSAFKEVESRARQSGWTDLTWAQDREGKTVMEKASTTTAPTPPAPSVPVPSTAENMKPMRRNK